MGTAEEQAGATSDQDIEAVHNALAGTSLREDGALYLQKPFTPERLARKVREIEPEVFDFLWKTPARGDMRLALNVASTRAVLMHGHTGTDAAGHVIECGAQATGGNYPFLTEITDRRYPGFPIAEVAKIGRALGDAYLKFFHDYDAAPVLDEDNQLVGVVTVDDALAVLMPKLEAQFGTWAPPSNSGKSCRSSARSSP